MAIVVDILMTIGVMFIVYQCTKKKSPAGLTHASKRKDALEQIHSTHLSQTFLRPAVENEDCLLTQLKQLVQIIFELFLSI